MERKRLRELLVMAFAFIFVAGFVSPALGDEVSLKVAKWSGDRVAIEMENDTPVLGVEFTLIHLPDVATVKKIKTTSRTRDFIAQFNDLGDEGVKVILLPLKGKAISPGSGPIVEIVGEGLRTENALLTDVNAADINNQPLKVSLGGK